MAPPRPPCSPRPLRRRSDLQATSGRYCTAAAMAAMSFSMRLARLCPASFQCSWIAQAEAAKATALHTQSHTKTTRCQQRGIVKVLFLRRLFFLCMNEPGSSFGTPLRLRFGTPLRLSLLDLLQHNSVIQDKLELNPCHKSIGSC